MMKDNIGKKSPHRTTTDQPDYPNISLPLLDPQTLSIGSRSIIANYIAGKFNAEDLTAAILPHKT